jgi:SAM-dependent methyltransferase
MISVKTSTVGSPAISKVTKSFFEDMPKASTYIEEAEFGLRRILPVLQSLPNKARVLEVGSGPCILLAEINQRFPNLMLQGIEPMGDGFAFFNDFINNVQFRKSKISLHQGSYETFPDNGKWDTIFLINVFEHIVDWRDFLSFANNSLAKNGRLIILCPNYGFPYESHFHLPIIFNKSLTKMLFRKKIEYFERNNNNAGLYQSLNFVSLRQVRRAAKEMGLNLSVNTEIINEMVDRLDKDPFFQKRQNILAIPAQILKKAGLLKYLLKNKFLQNYLPYMQITLSQKL